MSEKKDLLSQEITRREALRSVALGAAMLTGLPAIAMAHEGEALQREDRELKAANAELAKAAEALQKAEACTKASRGKKRAKPCADVRRLQEEHSKARVRRDRKRTQEQRRKRVKHGATKSRAQESSTKAKPR